MAFTAESPLCPNISLLYCCCTYCGPVFSPDLCLYKRRKFSVHGTISYIVFQNMPVVITACCTVDPSFPSRLMPAKTSVKSEINTVQYHPLCPNIVIAVLLLYILWTGFTPPTYACQCVKSLLYTDTISYVVFQNIVISTVL